MEGASKMHPNMNTWKVLRRCIQNAFKHDNMEGAGQDGAPAVHAWHENLTYPLPPGAPPVLPHGVPQSSLLQAYAQMEQDAVLACITAFD